MADRGQVLCSLPYICKLTIFTALNPTDQDSKPLFDPGKIGLGLMGRNILLDMADKGVKVIGYKGARKRHNLIIVEHIYQRDSSGPFLHTEWKRLKR